LFDPLNTPLGKTTAGKRKPAETPLTISKLIHLRITKVPVNFLSLISQLAQFVDGAIYPMMGHT
jgi:hypothetical protein